MKKILSLALVGVMMFSALPMAYAADVDAAQGTSVTVVGDGGEYFVTVPASLEPGQSGTVTAYGKWASNQTVKVTTDSTVEVEHQETGATTEVNVTFAGIESLGNDLEDMNVTAPISIDKGDIRFGEWKGTIIYNVEFDDGTEPTVMFYDVKYMNENGNTYFVFHEDGSAETYLTSDDATPFGSYAAGAFSYDGQTLSSSNFNGHFSEDGKTFYQHTSATDSTVKFTFVYTP